MKKNYALLFLILLYSMAGFGQGYHIQRFTLSEPIYNAQDSILLLVSGGAKKIAVVNPQTMDWKYVTSTDYQEYFTHLAFKNSTSAVAIGSSQNLFYSEDNLQTFTKTNPVVYANMGVIKTNSGYLAHYKQFANNWLYFSPNGKTWTQVLLESSNVPLLVHSGDKVIFHGFGSGYFYSVNGGQTFSYVTNHPASYPSITANALQMVEPDIWYLYSSQGSSTLYRTFNGGVSWDNLPMPATVTSVKFKNKAEGILYDGTNVQITSDSGKTWTPVSVLPLNQGSAFTYAGDNIYLGRNYISRDNGSNWEQFLPQLFSSSSSNDVYDLDFVGNTGIAVGSAGVFALSYNGGKSFVNQTNKICSEDVMAVKMINASTILAGDRLGQVHMSSDQGGSWVEKNDNTFNYNAQKFSHSSGGNVIVMTRNGQPVVSDDGGASFAFVSVGGGSHSQSVKPNGDFLDVEGIFNYQTFLNDGWRINKINTDNGSKTSLKDIPGPTLNLIDLHMADDNTGYLFTSVSGSQNMAIFKTTNGWSTYTALPEIPPYAAGHTFGKISVFTFGDTIIVAHLGGAGVKNYYHSSYNGGEGWNVHTINEATFPALGVHFFNSKRFIYGLDAKVAYINTGNTGTHVAGTVTSITFQRHTNKSLVVFPNPVSGDESLHLPDEYLNKKMNIQIFDTKGVLVLETESYEAEFSIKGLGQGLYMLMLYQEGEMKSSGKFLKK